MSKVIDLTGQKFGRLTVIRRAGRDKLGKYLWLCKCECGKETVVRGYTLKNGSTKSCGCLWEENLREQIKKNRLKAKEKIKNNKKICNKCKKEKPLESFYKDSKRLDGRQGWCKDCCEKYRAKIKKLPKTTPTTKKCSECGRVLKIEKFSKDNSTLNGYNSCCKDCTKKQHKKYVKRAPDAYLRSGCLCMTKDEFEEFKKDKYYKKHMEMVRHWLFLKRVIRNKFNKERRST